MPKKPAIHTVKRDDEWVNKREGSNRAFGASYNSKVEAEKAGRARAKQDKTEHLSHRVDGTIGERRSYGNDPHPPPG